MRIQTKNNLLRAASVTVCRGPGFHRCRTHTTSAASLGNYDNDISSIRVR